MAASQCEENQLSTIKIGSLVCFSKTNIYLCINFSCARQFESKLSLPSLAKVLQKSLGIMVFKYQTYINRLLEEGYAMPKLHEPNGMDAYRYFFANGNVNNHQPVCVQNPKRRLPDNEKFSSYSLSCFDDQQKAEQRYAALCKSFKRTPKAIGDSLCGGKLENSDGMVTSPDSRSGHFDLYESTSCDLSNTFNTIEQLWKE